MATLYNLFNNKATPRKVDCVIEEILTQQKEFKILGDAARPHAQLSGLASGLLHALELQHTKRTGASVDLAKDPLLLILELAAYYFSNKGHTLVTRKDGFLPELEGASVGAPLLAAYAQWYSSMATNLPKEARSSLILRDPKTIPELLKEFKLNNAATLASQFVDATQLPSGPQLH